MSARIVYSKPPRYYLDGKEVSKREFDKNTPSHDPLDGDCATAFKESSKAWPRLSDGWGVGAGQKEEAEAMYAKKGVPTELRPDGAGGYLAVIRNNAHGRELNKAFKRHNNHGGFGTFTS